MYRDILIATDGSEGGQRAADHALGLARALDATVHGLAVLKKGATTRDQIRADPEGEAEEALAYIKRKGDREGVAVTTEIRTGDPCETVVAYAAQREADLIVMGTTTGSRIDQMLHGSITQCVSRKAPIPVLSIGEQAEPAFEAPEDAEFRFHCHDCGSSLLIDEETRDALIDRGCIVCGSDVDESAFNRMEAN